MLKASIIWYCLWIFGSMGTAVSHKKCSALEIQPLLQADLHQLSAFTKNMNDYGMTPLRFEALFWKGLNNSFQFQQVSGDLDAATVEQFVAERLASDSAGKHAMKKQNPVPIRLDNQVGVFQAFSGKWQGQWKRLRVNHLWLPYRNWKVSLQDGLELLGFQSCFTGDGFGWNYLVKFQNEVIPLGYVYHFDKGEITAENPHFAFSHEDGQLTWVSDTHIYYEFVCSHNSGQSHKHYVINAIPYRSQDSGLTYGKVFQAIYKTIEP